MPQLGGTGDGDVLGVDLAVVLLKTEVIGVYPAKLPSGNAETLGGRVVLGGFGNLVDGATGAENVLNHRRVGGVNSLDRIVEKVEKPNVPAEYSGGFWPLTSIPRSSTQIPWERDNRKSIIFPRVTAIPPPLTWKPVP